MPSSATAIVEVPAPVEEAFAFLGNLENAAAWWPYVVGSVSHVRAPRRRAGARRLCEPSASVPSRAINAHSLARSLSYLLTLQVRHASRYLPDLPIKIGSCYRLLLSPPLAEVLHMCVVVWRPPAYAEPAYAEWRGSSAARHLRLELSMQRLPDAPQAVTRVELRWSYEWRGWRRLTGAVPAAHVAARAVGEQAAARIAAAFAQGLHLPVRPAAAPVAGPTTLADAVPVSVTTVLPGSASPELAVPLEDIHA